MGAGLAIKLHVRQQYSMHEQESEGEKDRLFVCFQDTHRQR